MCGLPRPIYPYFALILIRRYSYLPLLPTVRCVLISYDGSLTMTQLRSSCGPLPRSGAYIPLHTTPIPYGRSTRHIRPWRYFTRATSPGSSPRLTWRVTRICRRGNARSFVKTLRRQRRVSPSSSRWTTCLFGPRVEARVCGGGVCHPAGPSALLPSSKHQLLQHRARHHGFAHHAVQNHAHGPSHLISHRLHLYTDSRGIQAP